MTRKDGRPLVTEYPVTWQDKIDYIPRDELPPIPEEGLVCVLREPVDSTWMDDDPSSDDFDDWGA